MKIFPAVVLVFVLIFGLSCSSSKKIDITKLVGTTWRLSDLAGAPVLENSKTTLRFRSAERLAGSGGCNNFFADYTVSGDSLHLGPIGAAKMMCSQAAMRQESQYFAALQKASRMAVKDNLYIYCEGFDKPLVFTKVEKK